MAQTLQAAFEHVHLADKTLGPSGARISAFVKDLRDRSTPPAGATPAAGGTLHSKTAHAVVAGRAQQLPLTNWKMASGTVIGIVSSVTLPYFATASGVQKITWPGNITIKLLQEVQVPDNFSEASDTQSLTAMIRSLAGSTTVTFNSEARRLSPGIALGANLSPATKILTAGATAPEKASMSITVATLLQKDFLAVQFFPSGNNTGAAVELFAGSFEYTAEE